MAEKTSENIILERIQEAEIKRSRFLDLSGFDLIEIPDDIGKLKNLTSLKIGVNIDNGWRKISLNHLNCLPKSFSKLVNLIDLDLSGNKLSDIPKEILEIPSLQYLYLGANNIAEISDDIKYLKKLIVLDLSGNKLKVISKGVCALSNLEFLNLSNNKLSELPSEIGDLEKIRNLNLSDNLIEEISSSISRMVTLEKLFIARNQLTRLPPEIGNLFKLSELSVSDNFLSDIPREIGNLKNLLFLYLSNNLITNLPDEISELVNLSILDISDNQLVRMPNPIDKLINLNVLSIGGNNIQKLPDEIGGLENLQSLSVNNNHIIELPPTTGNLLSIDRINLRDNQIIKLPDEITRLKNLKYIDLSSNKINSLPRELGELKGLRSLNLNHNKIPSLPSSIGGLRNLQTLILSDNEISSLPDDIEHLENLELLYAENNHIEKIPSQIGALKKLFRLNLTNNKIQNLPKDLKSIKSLKMISLGGNKLAIADEILAKTDNVNLILDTYFNSKRRLNEAKCIIVGQGSVGKTSIVNCFTENSYNSLTNKTEGINIRQFSLTHKEEIDLAELNSLYELQKSLSNKEDEENTEFLNEFIEYFKQPKIKHFATINIWDFGGQEIMHATHQFFLTKRSLYLLVLDSRLTQEENRVEYWLKIIQSFGGESPVLVIGNKIDQHPLDIDRTGLQKKYPNIVGILETSAATGAGIEELKSAITEQVNNLPHVRDLLPETWFTVKTKLEELGHQSNYITHDKYLELCTENEVSDETSQRTLIGFLHDLGVVLHFQDDPRLEALGILNPQWATNGVYKILNSHTLFQNKGVLTVSMLDEILNLPEYPRGKRLFIVDMMKKFELCYDIEPDKTFLVPDLLPKDEPAELKFNGVPAFEYAYPVLPSSVITRFIVRMNQKIEDGLVWRTGVVLKIGENKALVKADIEDRKITIAIDGVEHTRRDALSAIRYQLDEIHGSIKGLDAQKRVPIPEAPAAEPLDYDYLLQLEQDGFEEHPVKNGNRLVKVNVKKLLSGVMSETERKQEARSVTNFYIAGDVNASGDFIGGDKSTSD